MALKILLLVIVTALIIGRLYKAREVIHKLSWWERIYTVILYFGLFSVLMIGMSELMDRIRQLGINRFFEIGIEFILLFIGIWIVTSILRKLLPEEIIKSL